jgi:hypothetical protein
MSLRIKLEQTLTRREKALRERELVALLAIVAFVSALGALAAYGIFKAVLG